VVVPNFLTCIACWLVRFVTSQDNSLFKLLAATTVLQNLSIGECVDSISNVSLMWNLKRLEVGPCTKLDTDLPILCNCLQLETLFLDGFSVVKPVPLMEISKLKKLKELGLRRFGLEKSKSYEFLPGLSCLTSLYLTDIKPITDDIIPYLMQLTQLTSLGIVACPGISEIALSCIPNIKILRAIAMAKITNKGCPMFQPVHEFDEFI